MQGDVDLLMPVMCRECMEELAERASSTPGGIPFRTKVVPVQTVGLYRSVCDRGHEILMLADFQQFELLFDSAMEAFVDGYLRESVSSFAAALERYYEFAIQAFLIAQKVDVQVILKMWKDVRNQSERQLGMYCGLYTSAFGAAPKLLPDPGFRNNVIHKGYFPSPAEALEFGRSVYGLLNDGIRELRENFHDAMQAAREIARQSAFAGLKPGESPTRFGMATTVSLMVTSEPPSMEEAVAQTAARLKRQRDSST